MNNTNLIRQLAERGMGWHYSDSIAGYIGEFPMFTDQYCEGGIVRIYNGHGYGDFLWAPLINWEDCMGLVERMEEDGFDFEFRSQRQGDKLYVRAKFGNGDTGASGTCRKDVLEENALTIICTAAAKALGIDIE